MLLRTSLIAMTLAAAASAATLTPEAQRQDVEQWRTARLAALQKPDGWLSLIGLHWVDPGTHRIGSAADNDIVLGAGPAHLGTLERNDTGVLFTKADGVEATIGDSSTVKSATLVPDSGDAPTFVRFGTVNFHVIQRGDRYALRVKDENAATRTGFVGLDSYPIDPGWRIEGRFERHAAGQTIPIANVIGTLDPTPNPGVFVFERDGKEYRLEAVDGGPGQVWFIYADRTSGKETYGAGRFLYAPEPEAGSDRIVVDFNKSYNPPCVFTPYATCPLAPPENRLEIAVTAGEKRYRNEAH